MTCPICDQKPMNCDCTETERRQFSEIEDLKAEIDRLRSRLRLQDAVIRSGATLALTSQEQEAVETAALEADAHQHAERAATLRGLLDRLSPSEHAGQTNYDA